MNQKERQSAETKQKFVDAAFELFEENGYAETSMNAIAQRAGFSRANLYLHFSKKSDIVRVRMKKIEVDIYLPFAELFAVRAHDETTVREWLEHMREMWSQFKVEFHAMEQAMSTDEQVASEWLDMIRRIARQLPGLSDDTQRYQDFIALLMGLDRNFYFLYVRNNLLHEEYVLQALTRQWLTLFRR
ncbi:TetR/AcrR family transcriptional regulator [Corynebacterium lubricantis]|uniref:TetR/AcrR family transcriptional regulator n=1 Tax=Corynebacterium lubricantis TaxID=541095 RepID=UPI000360FE37|nr:TetR/AcrR family transcriptional regulator [Corynebacterium lubricantis]